MSLSKIIEKKKKMNIISQSDNISHKKDREPHEV